MSTQSQIKKNLKLSNDLSTYLIDNPQTLAGLPSNSSIVAYSKNDETLNKANDGIVKSLMNEGTTVIKAIEPNQEKLPWKFSSI
jgi:hypothetical protein